MQSSHLAGAALVILAVLLQASFAFARPDSRSMSCAQVRELIERNRAVVIATGPHTWERYVSRTGRQCSSEEGPRPATIPTRDGGCAVLRCERLELPSGR